MLGPDSGKCVQLVNSTVIRAAALHSGISVLADAMRLLCVSALRQTLDCEKGTFLFGFTAPKQQWFGRCGKGPSGLVLKRALAQGRHDGILDVRITGTIVR